MQRIVLVGKACSGKDYLRTAMGKLGMGLDISMTTRPPRPGEVKNVTYHYVTKEEFELLMESDQFYETAFFNNNYYGTLRAYWDKMQVFIMTPSGIKHITPEDRRHTHIVYLDMPEEVRRQRLHERKDSGDKIERRLAADDKDFVGFTDYDTKITDPLFDAEACAKELKNISR